MNTDMNTVRLLGAAQLIVIVGTLITDRLLASVVGSGSVSDILLNIQKTLPGCESAIWLHRVKA